MPCARALQRCPVEIVLILDSLRRRGNRPALYALNRLRGRRAYAIVVRLQSTSQLEAMNAMGECNGIHFRTRLMNNHKEHRILRRFTTNDNFDERICSLCVVAMKRLVAPIHVLSAASFARSDGTPGNKKESVY